MDEEKKENFLDKKISLPKINFKELFSMKSLVDKTSSEYNPMLITILRISPVVTTMLCVAGLVLSSTIFSIGFFSFLMAFNIICSLPLVEEVYAYHCKIKNEKILKEREEAETRERISIRKPPPSRPRKFI